MLRRHDESPEDFCADTDKRYGNQPGKEPPALAVGRLRKGHAGAALSSYLTADGHWIPDEELAVKRLVAKLIDAGARTEDIFLISPFKSVVRKLYAVARNLGIEKVGTIHTVQGKEADIVILVLGGNPQRPGAKQWASSKPNLLNVAVSRAKHRLYVIGHYNDWKRHNHFSTCATHLQKTQYKVPARKADQASGL
ncbi:MAG: AAA domain-containing protein [Acidithiobacillus sp.]